MIKTICIHRSLLGEDQHFIISDTFERSLKIPKNVWVLGDESAEYSLDLLFKLSLKQIPTLIPEKHVKAFSEIGYVGSVPWKYLIDFNDLQNNIKNLVDYSQTHLNLSIINYYTETFRRTRACLKALQRARINQHLLEQALNLEKHHSNLQVLQSFKPNKAGLSNPIVYDQISTVTGRLVEKSGPAILRLKHDYRHIITSRFKEGSIILIDFKSLEPRFILESLGHKPPLDIYGDINASVFGNQFNRNKIKLLTIALLYGAGEDSLSLISGLSGKNLKLAISDLHEYFGLEQIILKLKEQLQKNNLIYNFYGRPIQVNNDYVRKLLNYYVQSSAVDVALLGFWNVIKKIAKENLKILPLFVIHDALMLDVHPDFILYIKEIISTCGCIPGFKHEFPLKQETIK